MGLKKDGGSLSAPAGASAASTAAAPSAVATNSSGAGSDSHGDSHGAGAGAGAGAAAAPQLPSPPSGTLRRTSLPSLSSYDAAPGSSELYNVRLCWLDGRLAFVCLSAFLSASLSLSIPIDCFVLLYCYCCLPFRCL